MKDSNVYKLPYQLVNEAVVPEALMEIIIACTRKVEDVYKQNNKPFSESEIRKILIESKKDRRHKEWHAEQEINAILEDWDTKNEIRKEIRREVTYRRWKVEKEIQTILWTLAFYHNSTMYVMGLQNSAWLLALAHWLVEKKETHLQVSKKGIEFIQKFWDIYYIRLKQKIIGNRTQRTIAWEVNYPWITN